MLILPDGRVVAGGSMAGSSGIADTGLGCFLPNDSIDASFQPADGCYDTVWALARQTDQKILIGGSFARAAGSPRDSIARLHPNGALDEGFDAGPGVDGTVQCLAIQSDGRILVGGRFDEACGQPRVGLARLEPTGALDAGFDAHLEGIFAEVNSTVLQSTDRMLVAGRFSIVAGVAQPGFAQLRSDGTLDATYASAGGVGGGGKTLRRAGFLRLD